MKSLNKKALLGFAVGMYEIEDIEDNLSILALPNSSEDLVNSVYDIPKLRKTNDKQAMAMFDNKNLHSNLLKGISSDSN